MKNKEKYIDKICDIVAENELIAVDKKTKELKLCPKTHCKNCFFEDYDEPCRSLMRKWLDEEYKEREHD